MTYNEEYHNEVHKQYFDKKYWLNAGLLWQYRDLYDNELDKRILDYGCGFGQRIVGLPNAIGYDKSKYAVEQARKYGINATTTLPEGKFDLCILAHVLEHVPSPMYTLRIIHSKLKENGKLIILLPLEPFEGGYSSTEKDQHLFTWNKQTITNLLHEVGYTLVQIDRPPLGYGKQFFSGLPIELYYQCTSFASRMIGLYEMRIIAYKGEKDGST